MSQFPVPYKLIVSLALATLAAIFGVAGFVFLNASSTALPAPTAISLQCGVQECHGFDVTCGSKVPSVCTEQYALGDKCRSHASCRRENGTCTLIKDIGFESCVSCVKTCQNDFSTDPNALFQCESMCE